MGEAQLLHIGNQALSQFAPVVLACHFARLVQLDLPGTHVQLIDRQRCSSLLLLDSRLHPFVVLPVHLQGLGNLRSRVGRQLSGQRHGVGLERQDPIGAEYFVLVGRTRLQTWDKDLPHAGRMAQAHRMPATVPDIEVAHHRDPPRIRRPHGEAHTLNAIDAGHLGPQATAEIAVITFSEQVQVHFTEQQLLEAVRVFGDLFTAGPLDFQQVRLPGLELPDKQPRDLARVQAADRLAAVARQHLDAQGLRQERADKLAAVLIIVWPENRERVMVLGAYQRFDVLGRRQCSQLRLQRFFICKAHDVSPPRAVFDIGASPLNSPCNPCKGTGNQVGRFSAS